MLDSDEIAPERLRPISRVEFHHLATMGAFEDERVELLRGAIVVMTPPGPPHSHAVMWLADLLARALGERALVSSQNPFAASEYSEPQPDVAVVPRQSYADGHPARAHLLVEVADSSLRKDRRVKREVYAEAEVPEYWIVNLAERVVEVYRSPVGGDYTVEERIGAGGVLRPTAFPDVEIHVDAIIPPRS